MNKLLSLAALCALSLSAGAQQNVKPAKVQLWMDVSTGGMAGMPEMQMPAGMGGGNTAYGTARGLNIMPPRVLDIALHNTLRPGVEASQAIPPGMRMGDSLPLLPPRQATREVEPGDVPEQVRRETPKGRLLIYWGCGTQVRSGQPRVIDLARANPSDFGAAFAGRFAQDRGARVGPQYALYPNERSRVSLARESSLVGEHKVIGEGVPASMKFTLGAAQDLMPAIELQTQGTLRDSIALNWRSVPNARGYYLHAMAQIGTDMVLWSSAETGDTGMGLFDYLPNATIERWVRENVLLKPEATQCAVPRGIFAGEGASQRGESNAMLRMIAYGGESNIAYPPRPQDPRAAWEPEWNVRVRVKSNTMAMLGENARSAPSQASSPQEPSQSPSAQQQPSGLESVLPIPGAVNILRGILGR
jgi:hypothetical protein